MNDADPKIAKLVDEKLDSAAFTEDALALEFTRQHGGRLRYVAAWSRWLIWDGCCWAFDETIHVYDLVRAICREAATKANSGQRTLAKANTVAGVERLAKADRVHAATVDQWDHDPWTLNTRGTMAVNLRTGETYAPLREDYCTKAASRAPGGCDCPIWFEFLERVTTGDQELEDYLQRVVGYCLTGINSEQVLFFLYGTGANGKTVFINTIAGMLGGYAVTAPMEMFMTSHTDRHPTELAMLRGARLVTATETEDGRRWSEARIKALTGGDRIAARFMRQDFFEFTPQFKLMIAGNHKPSLRTVDEAIRRRIHMIPFTVTIPPEQRDRKLADKLKEEWPGILSWAIEGCLEWQRTALAPPQIVLDATRDYLAEEDAFTLWLEDCTEAGLEWEFERTADLFASWKKWADRAGEFVGSQKRFAQNLQTRGLQPARQPGTGHRGFKGIRLKQANYTDDPRVP